MKKTKQPCVHLEFDLKSLELIYKDLTRFVEENPEKNKEILIERIRQMTEFQIWGEKHNDTFFELFCERNVLDIMLTILKKARSKELLIQIIQSLSMYLTNIKKPVNINYILSNNSINEFITHNFDFNDDEVVDYYISFLKSLSLRMETIPLELFYNKKYKDFPLLSKAVKFYNFPGSMVRTSVHNITLTLFQLKDTKLDNYLSKFPFATYYINLSCYLKEMWIRIDELIPESNVRNYTKLQDLIDDQYDLLMYIEDIFKLKKDNISKVLANALLSHAIIPTLISPLASNDKGPISLNLSLYFINLILNSFTYSPILEFIFITLMSPKITGEILGLRQSAPDTPVGFSQVWSLKTLWDSREDVLNQKYLELLDTTLENLEHSEVESPGTKPQYIKSLFNLEEEFRNLARYTGLVTEPLNKELLGFEKLSPLNLLEKFKKLFSNKGDLVNEVILEENCFRKSFLSFLVSRDDSVIMLICSILDSALNPSSIQYCVSLKTFAICQVMFEKCLALTQVNANLYNEDIRLKNETCKDILDSLYKLLNIDIPFRVSTLKLISKLIIELSESKDQKVAISQENLLSFNEGYRNSIMKVLRFLQNSIIGDLFSEIFEMQWKDIYKQPFNKIKRKDYVFTLIPLIEEQQPGIDLYMRVPVSECELAQKEISIYLLFRRIRYSLIKITKYSPSFSENYRSTNSKENLSNSWIEGKEYEIDHRKLHLCNIKDQLDIKQGYFAEDEENLIILTLDSNKLHWAKIHTNIKLRNVEVIVDRTNLSNLILNAKSKEKYLHKILTFADQNLCLAAKRAIDENRRYFKHYEMSLLLKNFDNTKNDIYESDI